MPNRTFYIVDVFAEEKYSGNQLAVVADSGRLSSLQMQQIANETHFSETTFVVSREKHFGGYDVRIFTPTTELPFAGHPTLGTAYVINQFIAPEKASSILLNLKVGQIKVDLERDQSGKESLWMTQPAPTFGKTYLADDFAKILGVNDSDIEDKCPIQEVSTGLPFVIVPLKTLDAVKHAHVNRDLELRLMKDNAGGILVFSRKTCSIKNDLHVRVFADSFGIPEDPATGSGNGCLAAYLSKYGYFDNSDVDARVEQGCEIKRPSLLRIKARNIEGKIRVQVGGNVLLVAKGELI